MYGSGLGLHFLTAVEVMDGSFSEWGASTGDNANASGTALYKLRSYYGTNNASFQNFPFIQLQYARYRPNV
jgi:hypothetical protein